MVALNELFVSTGDLEEFFVDKDTGLPLAGGLIYFYRASPPNVLKAVYQLSGTFPNYTYTALPNPLTLSAVGTVQNAGGDNVNILYYPWTPDYGQPGTPVLDLYYVVVTDSDGTVQLTRNPWPLLTAGSGPSPIADSENLISNQIANPTFTNTFLNPGIDNVLSVTAATLQKFYFAPDWFMEISGTGSVTLKVMPISGSQNVPGTPPYMLDIIVGPGITVCRLVQRFLNNSGLWASISSSNQTFLYGSAVAQNENPGSAGFTMYYRESTVGYVVPGIKIFDANFTTPYAPFSGSSVAIPTSTNALTGPNQYVDVFLELNPNSHIRVSAIQLIPSSILPVNLVHPDFDSSNRNEAYQGDYYIPRLNAKQIDSFLVGWDFAVNPFQFPASGPITTTPKYIVDQTIAAAATTNVGWNRDAVTGTLQFGPVGANDAFYIMQYLTGDQVKNMANKNTLSVNVFSDAAGNVVTMRVYLFRTSVLGAVPILPASIGTIAPSGVFTPTAVNWVPVPRGVPPLSGLPSLPVPTVTIENKGDYGFSGWQIDDANTQSIAIVVTFAYIGPGVGLTVNSISCVPGDLPCRPAVKSFDETLRQCQYYYEKTYLNNTPPGTPATTTGSIIVKQGSTYLGSTGGPYTWYYYINYIQIFYRCVKRVAVTPDFYAIDGTIANVLFVAYAGAATVVTGNRPTTDWTLIDSTTNEFTLSPNNRNTSSFSPATPTNNGAESIANFHYVADARLGIV